VPRSKREVTLAAADVDDAQRRSVVLRSSSPTTVLCQMREDLGVAVDLRALVRELGPRPPVLVDDAECG